MSRGGRRAEARWVWGVSAAMVAAGIALIARGSSPPAGPLPRFEPHGRDVGVALGIEEGPSNEEVAAEVARQGFYAGAPVGSGDCIGCHKDVAAQWASSAHRFSSFNNPYYRVATDAFRAEKGAVASRFCGNCHEPFLVATGAMDRPRSSAARAPRRPASPAWSAIRSRTSIAKATAATRRTCARCRPRRARTAQRLRPALMSQALFCAACHKVGLGTDVTAGERWLRGQNDYDAWHISAVSGNGAGSVYRPEAGATRSARTATCRSRPPSRATRARRTAWCARTGSWARTPRCPTCAATRSRNGSRWRTCAGARRWRCSGRGPRASTR